MATIPQNRTITNAVPAIIAAIKNEASTNFRNAVPYVTPDSANLREVGAIIINNPALRNEFVNALVNRIALTVVTSKSYENPWKVFKKGMLDMGETVEEIFTDLIDAIQYDPEDAANTLYKRYKPNVRVAFHTVTTKVIYPITVDYESLRTAFLSPAEMQKFIGDIISRMYTSAEQDEFQVMKYMIARSIVNGEFYAAVPVSSSAKDLVKDVKGISNKLTFMSKAYNVAGVNTLTLKDDQYVIINSQADADIDVDVLAAAFHMDKAEFMGHRILVDSFGALDIGRLNAILDTTVDEEFSDDVLKALDEIPMVIVDKEWFQVYDALLTVDEVHNGKGLSNNYFLHKWTVYSRSPFANGVMTPIVAPTVTSITSGLTSDKVTVAKGAQYQMFPTVAVTGFASKAVDYVPTAANAGVHVSAEGLITVDANATGTATYAITSVYDPTKKVNITITVG